MSPLPTYILHTCMSLVPVSGLTSTYGYTCMIQVEHIFVHILEYRGYGVYVYIDELQA